MSLMQQYAINEGFTPSSKNIKSVNGPPGTGKTTLLQEIIAENITLRAAQLAKLDYPDDAFEAQEVVTIDNNKTYKPYSLKKNLLGYEMVVVSSNNNAVENISLSLPDISSLGAEYKNNFSYLKSVANKVSLHTSCLTKMKDNKNKRWGLISSALGNSKNRSKFRSRLFFEPEDKRFKEEIKKEIERKNPSLSAYEIDEKVRRAVEENKNARIKLGFETIWEWGRNYECPPFYQAKEDFNRAQKKVLDHITRIEKLVDIKERLSKLSESRLELTKVIDDYESEIKLLDGKGIIATKNIERLETQLDLRIDNKPWWLIRFFNPSYNKKIKSLKILINGARKKEVDISWQKESILKKLKAVKKRESLFKEECKIENEIGDISFPPQDGNLDNEAIQRKAFWQTEELNVLRADVFQQALRLHEVWLCHVMRNKKFKQNLMLISSLLERPQSVPPRYTELAWQSLFMVLPVVSSTFASVANQFSGLRNGALGWILIDEAAQATPQSAVGAIWRAKNIVAVGDPLQIEPVFTVPLNLVEGLAKDIFKETYDKWMPTHSSVQALADNTNKFGAYVDVNGTNTWIGSPLRVHRRCLDPMFSISNKVAYDGKMISARGKGIKNPQELIMTENCWFQCNGEAKDRQYVQEQGALVLSIIAMYYLKHGVLPHTYVITPFKKIKLNLIKLIKAESNWKRLPFIDSAIPTKTALKNWCKDNIGTVHTFQGRESRSVIFVLGADESKKASAQWAASKVNLLNVAVTRAKDRIVVIGDELVWGGLPYFSELRSAVKLYQADQFEELIPLAEDDCEPIEL